MKRIVFLLVLFAITINVAADEGMWLINLISKLQVEEMKSKGMEISLEDIYSLNKASIKDAIVAIDNFSCTGSIISEKGLMITNHHCAYEDIQQLSSIENDYLKNGYWAQNLSEEIPIQEKSVQFLIKVEDFTERLEDSIKVYKKKGIYSEIQLRRIKKSIEKNEENSSNYTVSLESFFGVQNYYMFYYEVFKDVRLVGAPPSSVAAFGGDTDNWMWPQHKGDFAFYRIYTAPDGSPAEYAVENIPLKPKYHLTISAKGYHPDDLTIVLGYPNRTNRISISAEIFRQLEIENPPLINAKEKKLQILKEVMQADDKLRIQYASEYFNLTNKYKYAIGQSEFLKQFDVIGKRQDAEKQFVKWVNSNKRREQKYGGLIEKMEEVYTKENKFLLAEKYYVNCIFLNATNLPLMFRVRTYLNNKKEDPHLKCAEIKEIEKKSVSFFNTYEPKIDQQIFAASLKEYFTNTDSVFMPEFVAQVIRKYDYNFEDLAEDLYTKSIFNDSISFNNALPVLSSDLISSDTLYLVHLRVYEEFRRIRKLRLALSKQLSNLNELYQEAMLEWKGDALYPDANATMRLNYGEVGGYEAKDAVYYDYYTTSKGYLEKEIPEDFEFDIPSDYKELLINYADSNYRNEKGEVPINFLTDNDITGGNSGSPVLNGKGELIGLAFDGNWESMASDFYYVEGFNKSVCLDIRYALFILENYTKLGYLIDEMTIKK